MIGDNGRLQYLRFCLFEMYVNVLFVIRCLYSAVSLTLVKEQRFIRIIYLIIIIIIINIIITLVVLRGQKERCFTVNSQAIIIGVII